MNRIFQTCWIALLIWGALPACLPGEGDMTDNKADRKPFFDLKGYFEKEIDRLQKAQPAVRKRVVIGEHSKSKELDSLDYQDELQVFLDADINRAAWWDQYAVDSTARNGRLDRLRYEALDEELRIREIRLDFEGGEVESVEILQYSDGPTATLSQELSYAPQSGYRIQTRQDIVLTDPKEMVIDVEFLREVQ